MDIKSINKLFANGSYQKALIEYASYAIDHPEISISAGFNASFALIKLRNKLLNACKQKQIVDPSGGSIENLFFEIPLLPSSNSIVDDFCWYRVDFVVLEEHPYQSKALIVPLILNERDKFALNIKINHGSIQSFIFKFPYCSSSENYYQGVQVFGQVKVGYAIQKIEKKYLASQFLFDFSRALSLDFNKVVKKSKSYPDITIMLGSDCESRYIKSLIVKDHNNDSGIEGYIDSIIRELSDSVGCLCGQVSNKKLSNVSFGVDNSNLTKIKSELGLGVDFNIEGLKVIGDILIVHGWIIDPNSNIKSIKLVEQDDYFSYELYDKILRFERPDVIKAFSLNDTKGSNGFLIVLEFSRQSVNINAKSMLYLSGKNGKTYVEPISKSKLEVDNNGLINIMGILPDQVVDSERCRKVYKPVFDMFCRFSDNVDDVFDYTYCQVDNIFEPNLSIIIPLYGGTRFELTQIPLIAALKVAGIELILAVDDPRILNDVKLNAERLSSLYSLPVRVVSPNKNLGFSGINNFAADLAKGELILFLNSDCFITNLTAIEKAMRWLENKNNGAVGFRLLFADKSIQHDGMSVSKWNNSTDFYLNDHPCLGTPVSLMNNIKNNSSMLTAACLMIAKSTFFEIGGFNRAYLRGDFEDSDLCLKLLSKRKKLGIVRDDGIYHLERQTISEQESGLRQKITLINSYIYSQRWNSVLSKKLPLLEVVS